MKLNCKIRNKIIVTILLYLLFLLLRQGYWMTRAFLYPDFGKEVKKKWQAMPSEFLIRKLYSSDPQKAGIAEEMLIERKEKKAVEPLLKLLHSWDKLTRESAIYALGELGDERAIEPLMKIVRKGRKHGDYLSALDALCKLHYDPIYHEVLSMANDNYEPSWVVYMLQKFPDKPETLPTLEKIAKEDPDDFVRETSVEALGRIGNPGAIPALEEIAERHEGKYIADLAQRAIEQIKSVQHGKTDVKTILDQK